MIDSQDVFTAKVTTQLVDHGEGLEKLKHGLKDATGAAHKLNHELSHVHADSVFHRLFEHTTEAKRQFGELGEHVKGVHENISELIPAMGAFAAVGSLAGLFETVEKTAESYGEMAHMAQSLGVGAQQLHVWNTVAKLTDTNAESLDKSMARLNRTLGDAASGKNKDAAALFAQLHLDPKSFKDSADALPALADAFAHTHDATMRARMAFALFGKSGTDMIPLLMRGADGVRELQRESEKLAFNFEGYGEGLEHYNESMKKLGIATGAFTDELGAKLAPVLQPIIDDMQEWVTANRDWITTDIVDEVKELSGWVKSTDWGALGDRIEGWVGDAAAFKDEIGGTKTALELLAGVWVAGKAISFVKETVEVIKLGREIGGVAVKLATELVPAWRQVEAAAGAAAVKEEAAASIGGATPAGAGGAGLGSGATMLGLQLAHLASQASAGTPISKDSVRADPHLAAQLTPSQIAGLPEHGGWRSGDGDGHSFVGDQLSRAWNWMTGQPAPVTVLTPYAPIPAHAPDAAAPLHPWDHHLDLRTDPDDGGAGRMHPHARLSPTHHDRGGHTPAPSGPNRVEISGQANVTVFLPNAPPGTTAMATGTGVLAKPTVQLGQAFHDHYGAR